MNGLQIKQGFVVTVYLLVLAGCRNDTQSGDKVIVPTTQPRDEQAVVINGHRLPPEPDPKVNNATLLGVDVNNNGVRDDVERYIYERFGKDPEYPKTKIAIAMQDAWATQKILENPTMESKKYLDDAIDCQYYWFNKKTIGLSGYDFIQFSLKHKVFNDRALKNKMLNTKDRIQQMFKFNEACSGHIFRGRGEESLDNCLVNIDNFGE